MDNMCIYAEFWAPVKVDMETLWETGWWEEMMLYVVNFGFMVKGTQYVEAVDKMNCASHQ